MYAFRDGKPFARFDPGPTLRLASTSPNAYEATELGMASWVELFDLGSGTYALLEYYFCEEQGIFANDRATAIDKPEAIAWALKNGCEMPRDWEESLGIIVIGEEQENDSVPWTPSKPNSKSRWAKLWNVDRKTFSRMLLKLRHKNLSPNLITIALEDLPDGVKKRLES